MKNDQDRNSQKLNQLFGLVRAKFFEEGDSPVSVFAFGALAAEVEAGTVSHKQLELFLNEEAGPAKIDAYKASARNAVKDLFAETADLQVVDKLDMLLDLNLDTHEMVELMGQTLKEVRETTAKNMQVSDKIAASALSLTADMGKAVGSLDGVTHKLVANAKTQQGLLNTTKEVLNRADKLLCHTDPQKTFWSNVRVSLFSVALGFALGVGQQKYVPIMPDNGEPKNTAAVALRTGDFAPVPSHKVSLGWKPPEPPFGRVSTDGKRSAFTP